jgi:hypothetical protein
MKCVGAIIKRLNITLILCLDKVHAKNVVANSLLGLRGCSKMSKKQIKYRKGVQSSFLFRETLIGYVEAARVVPLEEFFK